MIQLSKNKIILASASPRRFELFNGLDIPFTVEVLTTDEIYPDNLTPEDVPEYLAKQKLAEWQTRLSEEADLLVITADTVVILDGLIIEKPKDAEDAKRMLKLLSGKQHVVVTGCAIGTTDGVHSFSDQTLVNFKELSDAEIEYYINQYQPFDKAGSYGVQEWLGYVGVTSMEGSYFNVMGLPLHKLYDALLNYAD